MSSETAPRIGAACAIFDLCRRILLVKHLYGPLNWELPGGAALAGEEPTQTATREACEETGLRVEAELMTGVYFDAQSGWLHFVFTCARFEVEAPFTPNEEISACEFFSLDSLPSPISDFTLRRIHDAAQGQPPRLPVTVGPRVWL